MKLKEKTQRKFVNYFEKMSAMHNGQDFELTYSDIHQETGAANVTLKRAIQILAEEGIIEVNPGRNSRYARFRYLPPLSKNEESSSGNGQNKGDAPVPKNYQTVNTSQDLQENLAEMLQLLEHLRRRVRNQEMAIALLQDRIAELEDKIQR